MGQFSEGPPDPAESENIANPLCETHADSLRIRRVIVSLQIVAADGGHSPSTQGGKQAACEAQPARCSARPH